MLKPAYDSHFEQRASWGLSGADIDGMFRGGMDTDDIAKFFWTTEASVLRELNIQRSQRLGLFNPYRGAQ